MKKYILTESQIRRTISSIIEEEETSRNYNKAVQCFLNQILRINLVIDGLMGGETERAIENYQVKKGIYPSDGVWGEITASKLNGKELQLFDKCKSKYVGFFD